MISQPLRNALDRLQPRLDRPSRGFCFLQFGHACGDVIGPKIRDPFPAAGGDELVDMRPRAKRGFSVASMARTNSACRSAPRDFTASGFRGAGLFGHTTTKKPRPTDRAVASLSGNSGLPGDRAAIRMDGNLLPVRQPVAATAGIIDRHRACPIEIGGRKTRLLIRISNTGRQP